MLLIFFLTNSHIHIYTSFRLQHHFHIRLNDRTLVDVENSENLPVHQRKIGYVFQDARLFPHYNVKGNLRYGMKHVSREDFDYIVQLLGIEPLLKRYPLTLSGGEKQRVAIASAIASDVRLYYLTNLPAALISFI